jgi:hypothetical protein
VLLAKIGGVLIKYKKEATKSLMKLKNFTNANMTFNATKELD